jgi:hypothetical protein
MTRDGRPEYPIPVAEPSADAPKPQRAAQEIARYDYRADATPDYYTRHPEHRPRPIARRVARRRFIREGY